MSDTLVSGPPTRARVGRVRTHRRAAIGALLFPFTGVVALVHSLRAGRLAKRGAVDEARLAGSKAHEWAWISLGVGLFVYFLGFVGWLLTANNAGVTRVFFSWKHLGNGEMWSALWRGFWINIQIFLWAELLVLVWALLVAIVRMLPGRGCGPMRFLATAYVDFFRSLPSILVVAILGFGLPKAKVPVLRDLSDVQMAVLALTLVYGAYVSEVYRAGLESIHWSQTAAARSLGLSSGQTLRFVVVPQAVRRVIPPLMNDFIGLQKDTAIVSIIGLMDVMNQARFYNNANGTLAGYSGAAILFFVMTVPMTRWFDWIQSRQKRRVSAGGR
ncbi:MAG: ABC transporter permease subunit [Ilumatobacteraceae bacterium]